MPKLTIAVEIAKNIFDSHRHIARPDPGTPPDLAPSGVVIGGLTSVLC
jgi:hypothetical protein